MNNCTNVTLVQSNDRKILESVLADIDENFECYTGIETGEHTGEIEFSSPGQFPEDALLEITGKYRDCNLYIQVLSYDLSRELVEHHVYENGTWTDTLAGKYQNKH